MSIPIYYLYVKTHNITGLKYLGQTSKEPYTYCGSGLYWKYHLKVHGKNISTELIAAFDSKEDLREAGLFWSKYWNVIDSEQWANLCEENGTNNSNPMPGEKNPFFGKKHTEETKHKQSNAKSGINNPFFGKHLSDEHKRKIAIKSSSRRHTKESKHKIRIARAKQIFSDEHKIKLREAVLKRRNPLTGRFLSTNIQ